ncbi:hypothetical protein VTO42DRAFT_7356 [Malbranchea cinnamomea]
MARTSPYQVPAHVAAQLSHLTSRPDVQSTLILSRKDGSIIQVTGQLAQLPAPKAPSPSAQSLAQEISTESPSSKAESESTNTIANELPQQETRGATPTSNHAKGKVYKPTKLEILAGQIFAFVSSASALSSTLSHSTVDDDEEGEFGRLTHLSSSQAPRTGKQENDQESHEREEDEDVKLLRLRTKAHEIIIIPNRRFLLCVVHDVSGAGSSSGGR